MITCLSFLVYFVANFLMKNKMNSRRRENVVDEHVEVRRHGLGRVAGLHP